MCRDSGDDPESMPIGKIIIVAGCVSSLLMALVVVGGVYWWSKNKDQVLVQLDQISAQLAEDRREWAAFGRSTDNEGCLAVSLRRHDLCGTLVCQLENNLFLLECLTESTPTPGFCDDVPAKAEFMRTVTWRVSSCSDAGREDSYCHELFGTLQRFCGA